MVYNQQFCFNSLQSTPILSENFVCIRYLKLSSVAGRDPVYKARHTLVDSLGTLSDRAPVSTVARIMIDRDEIQASSVTFVFKHRHLYVFIVLFY